MNLKTKYFVLSPGSSDEQHATASILAIEAFAACYAEVGEDAYATEVVEWAHAQYQAKYSGVTMPEAGQARITITRAETTDWATLRIYTSDGYTALLDLSSEQGCRRHAALLKHLDLAGLTSMQDLVGGDVTELVWP